ncbi:hypothetical protein KC333_g8543 [Hortaea werneckii]|nr:hypothetical protein KC333_g8543 [Hortaea werneckii]KAI7303931.1 hypothetical protein KC326_g8577 [Hortaea werneckii]
MTASRGTPRIGMANAGGRIETYYVPYLTCTEPLLYRLMISSQLPALAPAPATAAPLPLHRNTRPKDLCFSPSLLSVCRPSRNRIPRGSICAYHRSPPAATSRTDIAIIEGGETATCKTSFSLFELFHRNTTTMTRTHKGNDRDHVGLANGTAVPEEHLPRYFGKAGFAGTNPAETKKKGSGKGNWGQAGISELEDFDYNSLKPRRRSNSMSMAAGHSALKTKFEAVDDDVAIEFDEALHGPREEDMVDNNLEKMSSSSSADTMGSIEEEMDGAAAATAAGAGQKK